MFNGKDITLPVFVKAMREVIAEKGADYEYPREDRGDVCHYVYNGQPDCLIGATMAHLGMPIEELHRFDSPPHGGEVVGGAMAQRVLSSVGAPLDVQSFARNVQSRQDSGYPWGDAFYMSLDDY